MNRVAIMSRQAPSAEKLASIPEGWRPGWWVVPLTVLMVVAFAGSGWSISGMDRDQMTRELLLIAVNTLPLLAIRRNPLLVVAIFSIAYPAWVALGHPTHELQSLPTIAAMFALGAWDRPLWIRMLGLITPAWMVVGGTLYWDAELLELTFIAVFFVVVWALGVLIADRRARTRALETRTRELEEARQELAERAVADERSRIARELHDVIAHAMSVITVQAGVGAHLADRRSDPAVEALGVIERTGREALEEMRRMLTVLRESDAGESPLGPQPTLADLPGLVEQVRQADVQVAFTTSGSRRELSPGLELAVYRIVQEALTNVVKHASGSRAQVTVSYDPASLEVEVVNGLGSNGSVRRKEEHGLGLRGMAERIALYGGHLETSTDANRFRITARFPLEEPDDARV